MTGTGSGGALRAWWSTGEEPLARLAAGCLTREGFTTQVALAGEHTLELAS